MTKKNRPYSLSPIKPTVRSSFARNHLKHHTPNTLGYYTILTTNEDHCLDRTPVCTFLGTGLLLPRWRTGKPASGRYLFYNHFISILIVIQYQRPDLRTLYALFQSSLVSLSQKSLRYRYGGIISSPFVYILIF